MKLRPPSACRPRALACAAILSMITPFAGRAQLEDTPDPELLLRQMSEELKTDRVFQFHAEISFDDVLVSGQKIQYAGAADVTVRRPNGIHVDYRDDLSAKRFWYDGKTGTLLDVPSALYSQVPLPGEIDAAVEELHARYAVALPLADLISTDLFALIDERALAWGYLGVHDAEGVPAHHIAIRGDRADLQVWIQKDGRPLPTKFVITYHARAAPQYQAVLMDWEIGGRVSDGDFRPGLPKGAQQIEFLVAEDRR